MPAPALVAGAKVALAGAKMVTMMGVGEYVLSGVLQDDKLKIKKAPENFEPGMEQEPLDIKPIASGCGKFKLSHGLTWVCCLKDGKILTIDPEDRNNVFEYKYRSDGYCSIKFLGKGKYNNTYVFAGNQAGVKLYDKRTVDEWELFRINVYEREGKEYCLIRCKRDDEYWYVDKEGKVRHRNKKEGHMLSHFRFHRLDVPSLHYYD